MQNLSKSFSLGEKASKTLKYFFWYLEAIITITSVPNRVEILKHKFTQSLGLPFRDLLSEATIQQVIDELQIKYRRRLFDPFVTLWAFLSQFLDVDKSCHNTVSSVSAYLVSEGVEIPSTEKARLLPSTI